MLSEIKSVVVAVVSLVFFYARGRSLFSPTLRFSLCTYFAPPRSLCLLLSLASLLLLKRFVHSTIFFAACAEVPIGSGNRPDLHGFGCPIGMLFIDSVACLHVALALCRIDRDNKSVADASCCFPNLCASPSANPIIDECQFRRRLLALNNLSSTRYRRLSMHCWTCSFTSLSSLYSPCPHRRSSVNRHATPEASLDAR